MPLECVCKILQRGTHLARDGICFDAAPKHRENLYLTSPDSTFLCSAAAMRGYAGLLEEGMGDAKGALEMVQKSLEVEPNHQGALCRCVARVQ